MHWENLYSQCWESSDSTSHVVQNMGWSLVQMWPQSPLTANCCMLQSDSGKRHQAPKSWHMSCCYCFIGCKSFPRRKSTLRVPLFLVCQFSWALLRKQWWIRVAVFKPFLFTFLLTAAVWFWNRLCSRFVSTADFPWAVPGGVVISFLYRKVLWLVRKQKHLSPKCPLGLGLIAYARV